MALIATLAVRTGGYTGQRDAFEEAEHEYRVSLVDSNSDMVKLETSAGARDQVIMFSLAEFEEALQYVRSRRGDVAVPDR